jgi:hypothetical protein
LDGRELMSVAALPAIRPGHHEHRHVHPTTQRPHRVHSFQEPLRNFDPPPIRALARVPKSTITAVVAAGPDANGSVTITGQTYRRAKVGLDLQADGTIQQTARANSKGQFQFTFTVGFGSTPVRLSATAHGHKATSTTLTVNRIPPPIPTSPPIPTPTPTPTPADLPIGAFQFVHSVTDGEYVITNQLRLDLYGTRTPGLGCHRPVPHVLLCSADHPGVIRPHASVAKACTTHRKIINLA